MGVCVVLLDSFRSRPTASSTARHCRRGAHDETLRVAAHARGRAMCACLPRCWGSAGRIDDNSSHGPAHSLMETGCDQRIRVTLEVELSPFAACSRAPTVEAGQAAGRG